MPAALFWTALTAQVALMLAAVPFSDFAAGGAQSFVPLMLAAGACFLGAVRWFRAMPRWEATVFWGATLAVRFILLPMTPGDDLWRYLWEGRMQLAAQNPYLLAPAAPELVSLRDADWEKINHPESAAIYPPGTELTFRWLAHISASPLFYKAVFAAADLLTIALLLRLTEGRERFRATAWYAWNPAVAYASAGGGHSDSLMVVAMTAAVWALHRAEGAKRLTHDGGAVTAPALPNEHRRLRVWGSPFSPCVRWSAASAAFLGIAIAFKLVPIFLLPVWFFALKQRAGLLVLSVAIPVALAQPFGGIAVVFKPLLAFADVTRFNDLVWWALEAVTQPNPFGRNWPFTTVMVVCMGSIVLRLRRDWSRSALWVLGSALILSPVLHPWYATWILPLACWRKQHAWTVLSISALSAFLLWDATTLWKAWQPNAMTRSFVLVPPFLALAWQWWKSRGASLTRNR